MSDTSLEEFLEETRAEHEQVVGSVKEIKLLIKQSAAEVERLVQRNSIASNRIRQLENNFDTVPREDIKDEYEGLISAQQRLFTMRGQVEKLQSDERNMEKLAGLQASLLKFSASLTAASAAESAAASGGMGVAAGMQSSVVRIIEAQESERKSLVKKMHDEPASALSNLILQAEICQRFFESDPNRARAELDALKETTAQTFGKVKDFIFNLRPMMLDDLGALPTLRRYIESLQEKNHVPITFMVSGAERRFASHLEVTLFRSIQELVTNSLKYARPTQIEVTVSMDMDRIGALIQDDGGGFDVQDVFAKDNTIGLPALKERIEMLGGEFNIESGLGQGTRAEFLLPIPEFTDI